MNVEPGTKGFISRPLEDRFWEKVDRDNAIGLWGCWEWRGSKNINGYGHIRVDGRKQAAHRVAYELLVGKIPADREIDHLCRNRACVNPSHMELVTHRENTLRGNTVTAINAAKTHCSEGHKFTPENTIVRKNGSRLCRRCKRDRDARIIAAKKQEQRKCMICGQPTNASVCDRCCE